VTIGPGDYALLAYRYRVQEIRATSSFRPQLQFG